jgi:hypothetical protein
VIERFAVVPLEESTVKKPGSSLAIVLVSAIVCGVNLSWESRADERDTAPAEEGFVPLFDGKTLAGWEGDAKLWKVEDGMIVGDSPGIKQNEFLATKKSYGNFELRLEFRLRKGEGNTGVQFRSRRVEGSSEVSGYQADIGEKYWGCLYDESRRNKILVQAPAGIEKVLRKDDWNQYVIRAQGDHITLGLNGMQTVDYREADAAISRNGVFALQVHSGGPLRVEFRRLRIRELPEE